MSLTSLKKASGQSRGSRLKSPRPGLVSNLVQSFSRRWAVSKSGNCWATSQTPSTLHP